MSFVTNILRTFFLLRQTSFLLWTNDSKYEWGCMGEADCTKYSLKKKKEPNVTVVGIKIKLLSDPHELPNSWIQLLSTLNSHD